MGQLTRILAHARGSGKSTFSSQFEALYPNDYVRVNQDALGSRKKCEDLTKLALSKVSRRNQLCHFCSHLTVVSVESGRLC